MSSLTYLIQIEDPKHVTGLVEAFTETVYGTTLMGRNLKFLGRLFSAVRICVLVPPSSADKLRAALKDILTSGKMDLTIASTIGEHSWPTSEIASNEPSVLVQRGVKLLERFDFTRRSFHCIPNNRTSPLRADASPLAAYVEHILDAGTKSPESDLLCEMQKSPDASAGGSHCISLSPVVAHEFLFPSEQLSTYLHSIAGRRSMDGPVSRLLLRRFSQSISRPLSTLGLHPNFATLAAAACALIAIYLFTHDSRPALIAGGFIWLLGGLLDEVDGELARLQGKESEFGAWLDLTLDRMLDGLVLLALGWPIFAKTLDPYTLALICISITLVATNSYIGLLYDSWMKVAQGRFVYFRIGRDSRNLVIFLCAVFAFRLEAIWIAGALSLLEIVRRLVVCYIAGSKPMRLVDNVKVG